MGRRCKALTQGSIVRGYIKSSDVYDRLLNECIRPNAEKLASVMSSGLLACIVFEPDLANSNAAKSLGWNGADTIFAISDSKRKALAWSVKSEDPICAAWLRQESQKDHVFVLIKHGLLLVNHDKINGLFHLVDPPEYNKLN